MFTARHTAQKQTWKRATTVPLNSSIAQASFRRASTRCWRVDPGAARKNPTNVGDRHAMQRVSASVRISLTKRQGTADRRRTNSHTVIGATIPKADAWATRLGRSAGKSVATEATARCRVENTRGCEGRAPQLLAKRRDNNTATYGRLSELG